MNRSEICWVVQKNMMASRDFHSLKSACHQQGLPFNEIEILPFSESLPDFGYRKGNVYYGSTTFSDLLIKDDGVGRGLFFNLDTFNMDNYIKEWGQCMLNSDAQILPFAELVGLPWDADKLVFIRPNADNKAFAGTVMSFGEVIDWFERFEDLSTKQLNANTEVVVSEPFHIKEEWRLWLVKGKVVAASQYRESFRLIEGQGCPLEVSEYAQKRALEYCPSDVFVMDICHCGDELFILECNCMNSAGFYAANISDIVKTVSDYMQSLPD